MSDRMRTIPFGEMLRKMVTEYKKRGTLYGIMVDRSHSHIPIGPAAGPHTQLAGNIISAFAAGASIIELKTVQRMESAELNLCKPGILTKHAVFNIEWSAELTLIESLQEFIKAYILIQIFLLEMQMKEELPIRFIMSVGYDLTGIQSDKMDYFLENMKHAADTKEWKEDIQFLHQHIDWFANVTSTDIENLRDCISDTVVLSTMHGCRGSEIEKIAIYLMKEKNLHTWIKLNPTLIGKEDTESILKEMGYEKYHFDPDTFTKDITLSMAKELVQNLLACATVYGKEFKIKLTNTLPVLIQNQELAGKEMYMSGPPLFALSIKTAALLAECTDGSIAFSYSGGADRNNVRAILESGFDSVTVCTALLKQGGYQNITRLQGVANGYKYQGKPNGMALQDLARQAVQNTKYHNQESRIWEWDEKYSAFCGKCKNCVEVCPNRANIRIETEKGVFVIHRDRLCNECGNCACFCVAGHVPYLDKFTLFQSKEEYESSENDGILYTENIIIQRIRGREEEVPVEFLEFLKEAYENGFI